MQITSDRSNRVIREHFYQKKKKQFLDVTNSVDYITLKIINNITWKTNKSHLHDVSYDKRIRNQFDPVHAFVADSTVYGQDDQAPAAGNP